jgi:hypothetical protein
MKTRTRITSALAAASFATILGLAAGPAGAVPDGPDGFQACQPAQPDLPANCPSPDPEPECPPFVAVCDEVVANPDPTDPTDPPSGDRPVVADANFTG